jgi:hypothetical protein
MKQALVVLIAVAAVACGSATTLVGAPQTIDQLKFRVLDEAGQPAYCDPDSYPVARAGGEQAGAIAAYPGIKADAELYAAIVAHEHLPAGDLTDAQKLTAYRAFKKLRALTLTPSGGGYAFSYRSQIGGAGYVMVAGTVRSDGLVTITSQDKTSAPNCPICLAATTLIATPSGEVVVTRLAPGMLVWTADANGTRIAMPILEVGSTPVPPTHLMVHLRLADGRELWASPGHQTADGRLLGSLAAGDVVDGSTVVLWELVPYSGGRTYDLLPAGPTGTYWADGILLLSTLTS